MSGKDCLCGCTSNDYPGRLIDRAIAEPSVTDEPTLMKTAMRLGRGHYDPETVLDEIRRRDLFRSPHPTYWLTTPPTVARWP